MELITHAIHAIYLLLWGDLVTLPLPGGSSLGVSLLVLLLIPTGIYFTVRTRFLPIRMFPEMLRVTAEKRASASQNAISGLQALIVSTASISRLLSNPGANVLPQPQDMAGSAHPDQAAVIRDAVERGMDRDPASAEQGPYVIWKDHICAVDIRDLLDYGVKGKNGGMHGSASGFKMYGMKLPRSGQL